MSQPSTTNCPKLCMLRAYSKKVIGWKITEQLRIRSKCVRLRKETCIDMSILFMVAIAPGFHLFPFRTEKLSPSTPMVLPNGGRVGSRRPIRTAWKDKMIFSSGFRLDIILVVFICCSRLRYYFSTFFISSSLHLVM